MQNLVAILRQIEENDINYRRRYELVFQALHLALESGFDAGVRIDAKETNWPVVFIHLPTGQVSWHVIAFQDEWDGHDTAEKYRRCRTFCEEAECRTFTS